MSLRFSSDAATALRRAIREAGGVEVFAIGEMEGRNCVAVTITCRGQEAAVPALLDRPRTGQIVIHNHPSGNLTPSGADMHLAGLYGDDGVGVVIVDSDVTNSNWVVEPHAARIVGIDPEDVERVFTQTLAAAIDGYEMRDSQLQMAHQVAAALSEDRPFVCEAGTGTGKSLAYLIPAALWALANDSKVIISTHTKALQEQLRLSDIPKLADAGITVRSAVLKGRSNYLCRRRLGLAAEEDAEVGADVRAELDALVAWNETTQDGSRADLPLPIEPGLWERVESDSDLTMRVRCPHYATCHYYTARRRAAGAHIVVVNHALMLADLAIRDLGGPGVLPKYHRVILDEAHHLEDAATGAIGKRLTLLGLQRATAPLIDRKRRKGALTRLVKSETADDAALPELLRPLLQKHGARAAGKSRALREIAQTTLAGLADGLLDIDGHPRRITPQLEETPLWLDVLEPHLHTLGDGLDATVNALESVLELFDEVTLPEARMQSLLEVRRATRRLTAHAGTARGMLNHDDSTARWVEGHRHRDGGVYARLVQGPIEVGRALRRILWDRIPGAAATSATLTVGKHFKHWMYRVGADKETQTGLFESPFDHSTQALLATPRDLPAPNHPDFLDATADAIVTAIKASQGGAFVLCTSYAAVNHYAAVLRDALPEAWPVIVQHKAGRMQLLERFRQHQNATLVGTDSFWEGVDVRGDALRLVIIPRLPFRVPTDPLHQARHERIRDRGGDPFRVYSLPEAIIKLKQGYGRLIRSQTDRGCVLLLDRRLHERNYGRLMLASLPPARRINAPWRRVREEMDRFWSNR